jgi:integrase
MGRRATRPRYYPSRKAYYVTYQGKHHCLANGALCLKCEQGEKEGVMPKCPGCAEIRHKADLRFAEMIHLAEVDKAEDNSLIFALCNRYLKWVEANRKKRTYQRAVFFLRRFAEECGHLKAKQLKPIHVDDWLAKMAAPRTVDTPKGPRLRRWKKSTRRMAIDVVNACLNWAKRKELISRNPIAGAVDKPGAVSRTKESLISTEDHRRMVEAQEEKYQPRYYPSKGAYHVLFRNRPILLAKGPKDDAARLAELRKAEGMWEPFAVLLRLLEHTGARPGELYNATAADWDCTLGAFVYRSVDEPEKQEGFTHKTARKGKDRILFVSDAELRAIIEFLCEKHPSGPILRNIFGEPWTDGAIHWRFNELKKRLGLRPEVTAYSYRHTSITNMLVAGQPPALVAEVHGTSVQMLQRHYGHLDGHKQAMAAFWMKAKATQACGSGGSAVPSGETRRAPAAGERRL